MKKIYYIIGIPGSGKSFWLRDKNSSNSRVFDDISQTKDALIVLENAIRDEKINNIYVCDVNFMEEATLQKAEDVIKKFMGNTLYKEFYVLFKSTKEISEHNVLLRNDGRNVANTIKRFVYNYDTIVDFLNKRCNNIETIITKKYNKESMKLKK